MPKGSPFRVVTHSSRQLTFSVALPADAKPLHATVEARGKDFTGLLASFFNPAAHVWTVRQTPRLGSTSGTHLATGADLTVSVVMLSDPHGDFELQVSLTKLIDAARHNDERFELKQRSLRYQAMMEEMSATGLNRCTTTRPSAQQVVTIVCPLESSGEAARGCGSCGFVLCGGGFVSDYPVVAAGPALPETLTEQFSRLLGLPDAVAQQPGASTPEGVVWRGWQVSAAPNAGLGCFAISLRKRVSRGRTMNDAQSRSLRGSQVGAPSGLMSSLDSSVITGEGHLALVLGAYEESQLHVQMSAVGGQFQVSLPPPYGSFSALVANQVPLFRAAHGAFYE